VYGLDEVTSSKPEVVEALILIGLLSLVVSRTLRELFIEILNTRPETAATTTVTRRRCFPGNGGHERSVVEVIGFCAESPSDSATSHRVWSDHC
jgi:hypothetical protein